MKKELRNCVNKYELMDLSELKEQLYMANNEHEEVTDRIRRIETEIYKRENPVKLNNHGKY